MWAFPVGEPSRVRYIEFVSVAGRFRKGVVVMLNVHRRFRAAVVLGLTMLCGFGRAALAAPYHADGTIAYWRNGAAQFNPVDYSYDLGVQAGGQVNFDPFSGFHAQADSIADGYGVRSHTYSQIIMPVVDANY